MHKGDDDDDDDDDDNNNKKRTQQIKLKFINNFNSTVCGQRK